ncbi:Nif3-like dinuclear metal center hexameric protein [Snodgrassella communis]|jgi:dinuclear metal center YbgI/SA1388 family protein|uniref:Nif3-like dinuclear metal center hexameric protein n=1 Tax=Snodgrassella communis TaxID=2946699 RepID=UPI000C1E8D8F|nr:Nif3-like dinuclear metal center hexameric protein [Snodgrassella communis]PIT20642.1 Nif3-like dinuclear metal center hexameric protein [Snodgrassella communis]
MAKRKEILDWCAQQLAVAQFRDFSPNGLQVEGTDEVNSIVCAVSASQAAIDFAVEQQADMLLVHHGMFWKNEAAAITGWKKRRIQTLLSHDINLVGYHLPLDAHQQWGNNVQLARRLGWQVDGCGGEQNLVQYGSLAHPQSALELAGQLELSLSRRPVLLCADVQQSVRKLAWCTGGGQSFFQLAIDAGVDAFVTGEVSEPQYHLAQECGVVFIAAGHHATERYGIQALAAAVAEQFGISQQFFDEPNPV